MKLFGFLLVLFEVYSCVVSAYYLENQPRGFLDDIIAAAIENARDQLEKYDPIALNNIPLYANLPDVFINAVANGELSKFSDFSVENVDLNILKLEIKLKFAFERIVGQGTYEGSSVFEGQELQGSGNVSLQARNITVDVTAHAKLQGFKPEVDTVRTYIHFGAFDFVIDGLGDDELNQQISQKVSNDVPGLLENNEQVFSDFIEPYVIEVVNKIISDIL